MLSNETYHAPSERQLLLRFWKSARGFWTGKSAVLAWLLTVLLIATVLLQLLTQYYLNFWNRDFFNAVERKAGTELLSQALRFIPLAAASLFLAVFSVWGRMTVQRTWRAWLSDELYRYWLGRNRFVRLNFVTGDYQAPEYRIAEDCRMATDLPVDLVLGLVSSLLTAATFTSAMPSGASSLRTCCCPTTASISNRSTIRLCHGAASGFGSRRRPCMTIGSLINLDRPCQKCGIALGFRCRDE